MNSVDKMMAEDYDANKRLLECKCLICTCTHVTDKIDLLIATLTKERDAAREDK